MPASTFTLLGCTRSVIFKVSSQILNIGHRCQNCEALSTPDRAADQRGGGGHKKQCDLTILSWADIRGHHRYFYRFGCSHVILIIFTLSRYYHTNQIFLSYYRMFSLCSSCVAGLLLVNCPNIVQCFLCLFVGWTANITARNNQYIQIQFDCLLPHIFT